MLSSCSMSDCIALTLSMPQDATDYVVQVDVMEGKFRPSAKRSFEAHSPTFVDGDEILPFYLQEWGGPARKRLTNRTPLQRERDRILYSNLMRKQTEKYHLLIMDSSG